MLALVAALAALAVVGRLAFAAIPNVKPTTDIVLFAGYALGAVPGFAVGAITALVSNIFLVQGPWTVWQMAGWGGVGVGGALLARAHARPRARPGRRSRSPAGSPGLAFGAWMDVYQWTLAARQDLDSYLASSGTSLPYNLAHAIGNVVLLPADRARVHPRAAPLPAPLRGALAGAAPAPPRPPWRCSRLRAARCPRRRPAAAPAGERAERYLLRAQNRDGGFGAAPGQALEPAVHRLGRAGAGGRGAQPARRRAAGGAARSPPT